MWCLTYRFLTVLVLVLHCVLSVYVLGLLFGSSLWTFDFGMFCGFCGVIVKRPVFTVFRTFVFDAFCTFGALGLKTMLFYNSSRVYLGVKTSWYGGANSVPLLMITWSNVQSRMHGNQDRSSTCLYEERWCLWSSRPRLLSLSQPKRCGARPSFASSGFTIRTPHIAESMWRKACPKISYQLVRLSVKQFRVELDSLHTRSVFRSSVFNMLDGVLRA